MHDLGETVHNQLLDLVEETMLSQGYPELEEVIAQAKTIERDLDVWLSAKGKSTVSLSRPRKSQ